MAVAEKILNGIYYVYISALGTNLCLKHRQSRSGQCHGRQFRDKHLIVICVPLCKEPFINYVNKFYENVVFSTQLSYHLMWKLLKRMKCYLLYKLHVAKGQKLSDAIFLVFYSPKKQRNKSSNFCHGL